MVSKLIPKTVAALVAGLVVLVVMGAYSPIGAQAQKTEIKVGFSMALSGRQAPAAEGQMQAYVLWSEQVNKKGGIFVKELGRRLPVKLVYYDDKTVPDTAVRIYEKLITDDKVDLLLSPSGTPAHFAIVPTLEKFKAPVVGSSAASMKVKELKAKYMWFSTPTMPDRNMAALVGLLAANKDKFKKVAVIYVHEIFPRENIDFLEPYLKKEGFEIVLKKDYPMGVSDLTPLLREVKAKNPDAVIALSYPADTFQLPTQAKEVGLNPKFFYMMVGAAAVGFQPKFGPATEGIATFGHWSPKGAWPGAKEFHDAFVARWNKKPDYLNSASGYMAAQVMELAVEKAGTLNWEKIRETIAKDEFMTINGAVKFEGVENVKTPSMVLQWQKGELEIVWPSEVATAKLLYPKPVWP